MNARQTRELRERIAQLERERIARTRTPDLLRRLLLTAVLSGRAAEEAKQRETVE